MGRDKRPRSSVFRNVIVQQYDESAKYRLIRSVKGSTDWVQRLGSLNILPIHSGCVNCICWNSAGDKLLSGSDDQHLIITHPYSSKILHNYKSSHRANIFSSKFLPHSNDTGIVSCSGDGMILHTDILRTEETHNNIFNCHIGTTYEISTIPDDPNCFLSCGEDCTVRCFDLRTKQKCNKSLCNEDVMIMSQRPVTALSINSLRPYQLAIGCSDSAVQIYDRRMLSIGSMNTSKIPFSCYKAPNMEGKFFRITSLGYSPSGNEILVSYSSEHLYLFGIKSQETTVFTPDPISMEADVENDVVQSVGRTAPSHAAPVRRLRLRGDWSDTGPDARPQNDSALGGASQARPTLHASLMQRMTDVLSRMLNDPATRAALSQGGEDLYPINAGSSSVDNAILNPGDPPENSAQTRSRAATAVAENIHRNSLIASGELVEPIEPVEPPAPFPPIPPYLPGVPLARLVRHSPVARGAPLVRGAPPARGAPVSRGVPVARDTPGSPSVLIARVVPIAPHACGVLSVPAAHDACVAPVARIAAVAPVARVAAVAPVEPVEPMPSSSVPSSSSSSPKEINKPLDLPLPSFSSTYSSFVKPSTEDVPMETASEVHSEAAEEKPATSNVEENAPSTSYQPPEQKKEPCQLSELSNMYQGFVQKNGVEPLVNFTYSDVGSTASSISVFVGEDSSKIPELSGPSSQSSQSSHVPPLPPQPLSSTNFSLAQDLATSPEPHESHSSDDMNEDVYGFSDEEEMNSSFGVGTSRDQPSQQCPRDRDVSPKRKRYEFVEDDSPQTRKLSFNYKQKYTGHRNSRTMIKEATFWGDNYIISGSDCGHIFMWEKETAKLKMLLQADHHVVNCVQPHPHLPILASSGIDYDVKLWAPIHEDAQFDSCMAVELQKRNAIMLEETRDTITVPTSFMIRMLACINQIRRGGRRHASQRRESNTNSN